MGHGRQVTFTTFVAHAQARMVSVTDLVSRMQGNYKKMLDYFKEDPGMAYDVFFKTLHAFVGAFEQARKEVDEAKRQEVPRLPPSLPLRLPLRLPPRLPLLLPLRPPLRPPLVTSNKSAAAAPSTDVAATTTAAVAAARRCRHRHRCCHRCRYRRSSRGSAHWPTRSARR